MTTPTKKPADENARHVNGVLPLDPFHGMREVKAEPAPVRRIAVINATQLAQPLPLVDPLVGSLGIVPGFPTCFAGYGFSRKTLAAQAFALSVATGEPLWGIHHVPQGRVLHFDYEQGTYLTTERYQRLARGMDVDLQPLGDALRVAPLPSVHLLDRDAADVFAREAEGCSLIIVDSLRAATPGVDENSSNIREPIDMLGRVSEKTGAVVLVIHHARKPSQSAGNPKYSLRGSSALFDAFSSVFVFSSEKDGPTTVTHEKSRADGRTRDDFALDTEDQVVDGDARGGLRVVQVSSSSLATPLDDLKDRIVAAVRAEPGIKSKNAINARVTGTKSTVIVAIDELVDAGRLQSTDHGYVAPEQ